MHYSRVNLTPPMIEKVWELIKNRNSDCVTICMEMNVELLKFCRSDKVNLGTFKFADQVAEKLHSHLNNLHIIERISKANIPGSSSSAVQAVFLEFAESLGFKSERQGLFEGYQNRFLRPDYYLPIEETGIILEVERGKTTINNMDLLDFWKCHLCENANYLFLMVPRELRQNEQMAPRKEFSVVAKRMASFFEERNYTNVYGLWLFGY